MELQLKQKLSLITIVALTLSSCSDEFVVIGTGDSVDERFTQSMNWNRTHLSTEIVVESDDYTFLTIADIHVGTTTNLDRFLTIARTEKPVAVVIAGDITGGFADEYDTFEKHFPKNDSLKSFCITGNHDLWNNGWKEFYSRFGSSSYSYTVKTPANSDLFICIDTGGGTLGELQTKWLTEFLKEKRSEYRRCFVFTHVNLLRPRKTTSTNLVEEELCFLLDLFAENKVDLVITGHDHVRDVQQFGGTTYIQVDALEDGLNNAGFFKVNVKEGEIGYDFFNLNN